VYSTPHIPAFREMTGWKNKTCILICPKSSNWKTISTFHCRFVREPVNYSLWKCFSFQPSLSAGSMGHVWRWT